MRLTKAERERQRELRRQHKENPPKENPKEPNPQPVESAPKTTVTLAPVPVEEWHGCYDDSWRGMITPESFSHPAKAGRRLLHKIYDHLDAHGIKPGSIVVDPFGGIGTTALIGAWRGYKVICCELEPKFADLANKNVEAQRPFLQEMNRPIPTIVQGDSRQLRQHIKGPLDAIVTSPPYSELGANIKGHGILGAGVTNDENYGNAE